MKSAIASFLAGTLIATSPGLFSYQAFARVTSGASAAGRTAPSGLGNVKVLTLAPGLSGSSLRSVESLGFNSNLPVLETIVLPQSVSPQTAAGMRAIKTAPSVSPRINSTPLLRTAVAATPDNARKGMSDLVAGIVTRFAPALPGAAEKTTASSPQAAMTLRREFDGSKLRKGSIPDAAPVTGRFSQTRRLLAPSVSVNAADTQQIPQPHKHGITAADKAKKTSPLQWALAGASAVTIIGVTVFSNVSLVPIVAISGALLLSILAHESAHILGLRIWGDPTPKDVGRDHINPLMHIDPIGTILVPAASLMISQALIGFPLLFGWAKPVPVDFNNLAEPKAKNAAKVAALGPLMNLALAGLAFAAAVALPAYGLVAVGGAVATSLAILWKMNLALFAFNLLPLPWLDGGKLLVSMFPKNIYARWTANPNLPTAYQGIFRKIYEGPANVLSKFHVHSMGQINGITRLLTLGALGAFYAVFFSAMQIPFLFLALPCSYDYYCIREKVRSEQAVEEMMDLMSEWGAALAQIGEDHDAESEVSTFEAEHAMKNAVDYLLEDLMAKEEFRALSEEEQIKEFMRVYPDWATRYLKDKVFTEDTEEKIREILADERNKPFMKRLEKWLSEHKIFDKMASPHAKKKYKDASEEADNDKKRTMGGFLPITMLPSMALGGADAGAFTGLFELVASMGIGSAMLSGITSRSGSDAGPTDKIVRARGSNTQARTLIIRFTDGVDLQAARDTAWEENLTIEVEETINGSAPVGETAPTFQQLRVTVAAGNDLTEVVARLAQRETVKKLVMHESSMERAITRATQMAETQSVVEPQTQLPLEIEETAPVVNDDRLHENLTLPAGQFSIELTISEVSSIHAVLTAHNLVQTSLVLLPTGAQVRVLVSADESIVDKVQAMLAAPQVTSVTVRPEIAQQIRATRETTTAPETAETPVPAETHQENPEKIVQVHNSNLVDTEMIVHFSGRSVQEAHRTVAAEIGNMTGVSVVNTRGPLGQSQRVAVRVRAPSRILAIRAAKALSRSVEVMKIAAHETVYNATRPYESTPVPATEPTVTPPAARPADGTQKLESSLSMGQNRGRFDVHFRAGTSLAQARQLIQRLGMNDKLNDVQSPIMGRFHIKATFTANDAVTAVRMARRIAQKESVTKVAIHPAAANMIRLNQRSIGTAVDNPAEADAEPTQSLIEVDYRSNMEPLAASVSFAQDVTQEQARTLLTEAGITEIGDSVNGGNGYNFAITAANDLELQVALRTLLGNAKVTMIAAHESHRDVISADENPPAPTPDFLSKTSLAEDLPDFKDMRIKFKEKLPVTALKEFMENRVFKAASKYRWENKTTIVVHVLDADGGARLIAESFFNSKIEGVEVSEIGKETYENLIKDSPDKFKAEKPENHEEITDAVDEHRGVLVQWAEGTTVEDIDAYAEQYSMRVVESDYRGQDGLVLYETPKNDQQAWFIRTIASAIPEAFTDKIASIRPMREDAAAEMEEELVEIEEAPKSVEPRSVHDEWVDFLNTQELITGKTLDPKQAQLIASLLKPVQPPPMEKSHPIIGRTMEQKRVIPVLTAPRGGVNSVMLVGPAGTGKTAIGEGMAQLIEDSEFADRLRIAGSEGAATHLDIARLRGRWLVELDIDRLLASEDPVGTLLALIDLIPLLNDPDMRKGNRVILMLDEIQKLALDPAGKKILNALKVPIRNGKLSVLGTTTDKEWKEHFDSDEALKSRFEKLDIEEPTIAQTQQMLHGAKVHYEWVHDAEIEDDALDAAAALSDQFDKEEHNPRKSFKLVRSAAELARPDNLRAAIALDIREGWGQLVAAARSAKKELAKKGIASTIALPIETYNKIAEMVEHVVSLYDAHSKVEDGQGQVTTDVIKRRLAEVTGISAGQLTLGDQDSSKYLKMEEEVSKRVINQDRAIRALANAIRRNKSGLADPNRPMGKFLFVGPTGVGKTHLVKELARFLFDDPDAYVRFDMSEFMEEHTYMRLVGAPPSFVGYGEGGQLTEAIRKKPYSVILLDEVEKAHPKVWNIFLQILDDGRLTDGEGRTVDFKNTVIIMTSNAGMKTVQSQHYERLLTAKYLELAQLEETDADTLRALIDLEISELETEREAALTKRAKKHDAGLEKKRRTLEDVGDLNTYAEAAGIVSQLEEVRDAELEAVRQAFQKRIDAAEDRIDNPIDTADAEKRAEAIRGDVAKIETTWDEEIELAIQEGVREFFTPEFLNRLDEDPDSKAKWVTFNRLNKENVRLIAGIELESFSKLLLDRHDTQLEFAGDVIDHLTTVGFSPVYGARPVKAAIEKYIVDPLAKWVLEQSEHGRDTRGKRIVVSIENETTKFEAFDREKVTPEKKHLEGIAHAMTQEVMHLLEDLVNDELAEEAAEDTPVPSEALFDIALRAIGSFGKAEETGEAPVAPTPVFAPGITATAGSAAAITGEHNKAKKVDKPLRTAWRDFAKQAADKGYSEEVVSLLNQVAGTPGEAWVKNMIRHAKEMATRANKEEPVTVAANITAESITVVVHSPHTMDDNEKAALKAHLSGTPPADLKASQRKADQLNLTASMIRDSNLLDLYRRASEIPGARIGYRSDENGTDYVLVIPKDGSSVEAKTSGRSLQGRDPGVKNTGLPTPKLTPHQIRERARTRPVFWNILHSEKQDGPAINVAALEGWARLTTPADLRDARMWILQGQWINEDSTNARLSKDKHKVQLTARVLKRWGTDADLPVLEKMTRIYSFHSDYDTPAQMALLDAYAAVLARAGRDAALDAYNRADGAANVKIAAQRALGKVGRAEDVIKLMSADGKTIEPAAFVDLLERVAPEQLIAFVGEHWRSDQDGTHFKALSATQRKTVLMAIGRLAIEPDGDFQELKEVIESNRGADRKTLYDAAEAFALLVEKQGLGANLEQQMEEFLTNNSLNDSSTKWAVLLTFLYTAQRVGGPELLQLIEALMHHPSNSVSYNYEQPYFETPYTWARIVVRTGLITQFLQRRPGANGEVKKSKIETMLESTHPMEVAAALHAVSLAQGALGGHGAEDEVSSNNVDLTQLRDMLELDTSKGSTGSNYGGMYGGMFRGRGPGRFPNAMGDWDPLGPY